jgi:acyl-CoA synthetase (AMP-forming)/AMP-acid ligase II
VKKKIVLYYVGQLQNADMAAYIKEKLPRYMVPNVIRQLDTMPLTPNGKVNRNLLKQWYEEN